MTRPLPNAGSDAVSQIAGAASALPISVNSVGIIGGSGALGFGLATRWAAAGIPVIIGSRDAARAAEAAEKALEIVPGGRFEGYDNLEAARRAEIIVLSVPFRNHAETLTHLKEALREGDLIIDATVPLAAAVSGRVTRVLGVWQGSAAQQTQEIVPEGVGVVSALHSVSAAKLRHLAGALDEDVAVCGDDVADKRRAIELIEMISGLRGVDVGKLEMARITESLTPLLIAINVRNKVHAGIKFTGL